MRQAGGDQIYVRTVVWNVDVIPVAADFDLVKSRPVYVCNRPHAAMQCSLHLRQMIPR